MYYNTKQLMGYSLHAYDGAIGKVTDVLFHDESWFVRYLVVNVGTLLQDRLVLVAAPLLGPIHIDLETINVFMNKAQVLESPVLEADMPVSLRHERELFAHYGWPSFWNGFNNDSVYGEGNLWLPHPAELGLNDDEGDPHLRSVSELEGYKVLANDGSVGKVDDFVVDDEVWGVRYVITRTRTWFTSRKVLMIPQWVQSIRWEESEVLVDHCCDDVRNSMELRDDGD
jgi:uncharacterized protein YrrD